MSLRARLLVLILLATLLPALLVGWRFVRDRELEVDTAIRALATAADSIATDLEHRIQGTAQLHFGLAHAATLEAGDRAACSAYLSAVREAYPQYTGIISVLPDGNLFCDSLGTGRELNLSDRAYFQRASRPGNELVLEPVFGRLTGVAVLQIVHPVRDERGGLRYMLVASLNLHEFVRSQMKQLAVLAHEIVLLDQKGTVLTSSGGEVDTPKAGRSIAGSALLRLAQANANGSVGETVDDAGKERIWAVGSTAMTRSAGLHVMLGRAKQDLVADSGRRLRQDLMTLATVSLLLFVGVWLLAELGIRRQVGRITTMVRALGDGNLSARLERPYPRGELGGLMAALNSMASSLLLQRDAIAQLGLRLRQAQKLEALGTLAGGIAHDFNNILGAILGNLSLAHEEALAGQPTQQSLEQIRRAALRARALVQNIQAFSRADSPALSAQQLQPIVEEVLALVRVSMPAGASLRTELDSVPIHLRADVTQLHQVLLNLLTNAWQALQGEPGTVTIGLQRAKFAAHDAPADLQPGRYAHLWVSDSGCGMDAARRERIFEPFFTTKGARGGTGLGLSVVHGIVGAHGGSISVDSSPGHGSTFHVYLPVLADDQPHIAPPPVNPTAGPTRAGRGQHVLYVDDDEVMGIMVQRLLERAGYKVTYDDSALHALAAVRAAPLAHDLVVTDFNMPELSGLDVSRALQALRPGLPVLIISGYIFDELPAQARRAGVREVIRKEHVLEELAPAVARALQLGR